MGLVRGINVFSSLSQSFRKKMGRKGEFRSSYYIADDRERVTDRESGKGQKRTLVLGVDAGES